MCFMFPYRTSYSANYEIRYFLWHRPRLVARLNLVMCTGYTAVPFISFTYIGPSRVLILAVISAAFPLVQLAQLFFIFFFSRFSRSILRELLVESTRRSLVMGCCSICIPISRCQNDGTLPLPLHTFFRPLQDSLGIQ